MRLRFDLPADVAGEVAEVLAGEEVRYAVPADLTADSRYGDGWTVVGATRVAVRPAGVAGWRTIELADVERFQADTMVGCGRLIAEPAAAGGHDGNGARTLARYSMRHAPRYATVARALNQLIEGKEPRYRDAPDEGICPTCGRRREGGTRVCRACTNRAAMVRRLWEVARRQLRWVMAAMALFAGHTLLALLPPELTRILIDDYLTPRRAELGAVLALIGALALAYGGHALLAAFSRRTTARVATGLSGDLRRMVFTHVQKLSLAYLSTRDAGDILNRVSRDTRKIQTFINFWLTDSLAQVLTLIGVAVILFLREWRLAVLLLVPVPVVVVLTHSVWKHVRTLFRREHRMLDKVDTLLQDILAGIRVVKAFGRERSEVGRFRQRSAELRDVMLRNERTWAVLMPTWTFVMRFGEFLVFLAGGYLVLGAEMKVGELVQFVQYAMIIYGPLAMIAGLPRRFAESMSAAERVFEIIDEPPEVADSASSRRLSIDGTVRFEGVVFGYQSHEPVLEDISLQVEPGEMIGIVGHSGAGKTTLINLLMRLYDPDEGRITIDAVDLREIEQRDLHRQIGVVLQETFLFAGTIAENIVYAKPDATRRQVIDAAKVAGAHDFICAFSDGYDTLVGERGQRLSGGERQRVAIARAILHDPRILILDEATAAVDSETEEMIQEGLFALMRGRTTFAIAHRLATLRNADRLVVLDKGRLAEVGTHAELMAAGGIYHGLVQSQRRMNRSQTLAG